MALLPGFEYDIFISYRQNDNRSGWVTEFVKALQEELAATIKDPVSVYFDTNPHDGLLETHHVDKSLEGKLKCLIFIPIISQTYCDTKSFAWQQEFCAFNTLAKKDQFGRDIKLSSGNVASRILPIKIHDLDKEDKTLLESELGGVLRAIEFIYKSGGVNRPLNSKDDEVRTPGKILYRDQVNKVANAIKEIIHAMKSPVNNATADLNEKPLSPNDAKKKSNKKIAFTSIGLMILLALIYAISQYIGSPKEKPKETDKSIAVLPFADMSPNKDQEYLGDGIADEIITALSKIEELKVIGRTSSFQFKGEKIDLREVGDKLNVSTVLEGSVMKSGNKIRITAQLINVSDGSHIWSERYDKPMDDIFFVQDEISRMISDKMRVTMLLPRKEKHSRNPAVQDLLYQGNFFNSQRAEGYYYKALDFYNQALAIDSLDALVWTALASNYNTAANYGPLEAREAFILALKAIRKALELDNGLGEAYRILGNIKQSYEHDWTGADEEYTRAIELGDARALVSKGVLRGYLGDSDTAIACLAKEVTLDPINPGNHYGLGLHQYFAGRLDKAATSFQKSIELSPSRSATHAFLGLLYLRQNRIDEAIREFNAEPGANWRPFGLTLAYYSKGNREESTRYLSKLIEGFGTRMVYQIAIAYAYQGNKDLAFRWLEKAFQQNDAGLIMLKIDPLLLNLHEDARWPLLLRKMKFPEDLSSFGKIDR